MPPKSSLTREKIAECAFEVLRREGYDALNARRIAAELGVSTMPLFHHYENMDEIKRDAVALGVERYCEYMDEGMKDELPFKGVGRSYIRFAKEETELFKIFFMTANEGVVGIPNEDPKGGAVLNIVSDIMNGNGDKSSRLLRNMWLIVHGIATLEATGKMHFSDEELSGILSETFSGLKNQMIKED